MRRARTNALGPAEPSVEATGALKTELDEAIR